MFARTTALLLSALLVLTACKEKQKTGEGVDSRAGAATAAVPRSAVPAVVSEFDPDSIPVSTAALPPFPYLDYPQKLGEAFRAEPYDAEFDRASVIAGKALRAVEGKMSVRGYAPRDAQMSPLAIMRNYDSAIKALGGVRVDEVQPEAEPFVARNGGDTLAIRKQLRMRSIGGEYAAYLIRTPDRRIWIAIGVDDLNARIVTVEEKALQQSIGFVKADAMQQELDAKGRVALYINFDTDRATVRDDGRPVIDEIAKLLRDHPALKLSIEGHTDNSGDAAHNKALSTQRAEAVVAALTAAGIDKARLKAAGFGAEKPIADNGSADGQAKNRRVELVKL